MTRLVADANTSRKFVNACLRLDVHFPIVHLADWMNGSCLMANDPALLGILREHKAILVGFDRRTMAMHAGRLTREGLGHAGIILFRRVISQVDFGYQSRALVQFWSESSRWDWNDRIEYLPRVE